MILLLLGAIMVPILLLSLVPRSAFFVVVGLVALLVLLSVGRAFEMNQTCVSDGCIGAFLAMIFAGVLTLTSLATGLIRWSIIKGNRANGDGRDA